MKSGDTENSMASLLGNLIFAGLATLLTTQTTVGSINTAPNLYSINTAAVSGSVDTAIFQPVALNGMNAAIAAGIGPFAATIAPLLVTRTGTTAVFYNGNTTALPGEVLIAYWHSRSR